MESANIVMSYKTSSNEKPITSPQSPNAIGIYRMLQIETVLDGINIRRSLRHNEDEYLLDQMLDHLLGYITDFDTEVKPKLQFKVKNKTDEELFYNFNNFMKPLDLQKD